MATRVLIVVENNSFPADARVSKEAFALWKNGYDVTVLCPRDGFGESGYEVVDGIRVYRHPIFKAGSGHVGYLCEYGFALLWEFLYSWWIYLRHGFEIIQGCNPPDNIFLVAASFKLLGVKYIFDHHDASPELYLAKYNRKGFVYNALRWLERLTFRFSDCVTCTNESYKELALTRGGVDPESVFVVRNGPDLDAFRPVQPNAALKQGKPYLIGYVGVMNSQDGLDILVDVAAQIRDQGRRDIQFTCVGKGPALPGLRRRVREKNLEDTVRFTGWVPEEEMLEVLSTADVCVNPDRPCEMNNISTMIKIMEYMALGKPMVQFDVKEGRFSAGEASLYADPGEPVTDFAAKILWLLDHPEERARMGALGRRRVEEELAWEYSIRHLLAAYERATSLRSPDVVRKRVSARGGESDETVKGS